LVDFGRRLTAVSHHGMEWEAGLDEIPFVMDIKKRVSFKANTDWNVHLIMEM